MTTDYPIRPPSEQLVDLHVYLLPREVWNEKYGSTYNESITEARSAGFVRVWPDLTVCGLRTVIEEEIGDSLPQNYVFLRSVGRCMTQIKPKQELELKCKAFLPPTAWAPEIVVLEAPRDSMSVPMYQSFPGYSPRLDATQPINGIPTHFPQVANHDRMAPPSDGQSPMVQQQQQQGYKGDPLQSMVGMPGKSGRPDAYTNNTNEDSGIAEPTPDDDDQDYERRKSDIDDQYYNQLHPDQTQNRQFRQAERTWDESDRYQEKEIEEEKQRQEEIQQREEERRKEEERIEVERQREEERREHDRKLEQKRQEEVKKKRQREMERRKEEKMKEEMKKEEEAERQRGIAERIRAATFDSVMPLSEGDEEYNDATIAMETNQAPDSRGHFLNDEQMRRRAEDELQDYEPQSTWRQDGGGEMGHLPHLGRSRSREDTEMEMASQQAVQDGLKRVHLTPEVHRKAKIGKIRNNSVTDEEDIYETDPEMADLLEQLQAARQERLKKEKERENLIKRAKDLQTKTHERRNRSLNESRPRSNSVTPDLATRPRDYWKKRYYDEKKKTAPMEEQVSRVRNQLDQMHRKLLSHIEGKKKGVSIKGPPSKKNDHKINILKMQHELDEIKRKVDKSRMKLTSEIKLRNQAEDEVRGLKSEVSQRKINTTLIRNQKLAALKMGDNKLLSKTPIPALGKGPLSLSAKR